MLGKKVGEKYILLNLEKTDYRLKKNPIYALYSLNKHTKYQTPHIKECINIEQLSIGHNEH